MCIRDRSRHNLAVLYSEYERSEDDEAEYREAIRVFQKLVDGPDRRLVATLGAFASFLSSLQRFEEADRYFDRSLEMAKAC